MDLTESRRPETTPWVLVADGLAEADDQARTTLWTVRCLGYAGYRAALATSSRASAAGASKYCHRTVMVPPAGDDGFVPAVQQELHAGGFLTVIAASDPALLALGTPVSHLVDKSLLIASAKAAGLATPPTEVFETSDSLLAAAPKLEYPIVVKPTLGKPARCYRSSAELASLRGRPGPFVVQPYMEDGLWSIAGVLFQGELVASVHQRFLRTWPPDAGMACAAETIEADLDTEARVVELLDGHEGVFQVDLLGRHVLDVNPRVYASMSLAAAAGVNLVGLYCDFLRGRKPSLVRARPGVFFRWLEGDVRCLFEGVRTGRLSAAEAARSLRPRRHTARGGPESLVDPGPMLSRSRYILRRLKERASGRVSEASHPQTS